MKQNGEGWQPHPSPNLKEKEVKKMKKYVVILDRKVSIATLCKLIAQGALLTALVLALMFGTCNLLAAMVNL